MHLTSCHVLSCTALLSYVRSAELDLSRTIVSGPDIDLRISPLKSTQNSTFHILPHDRFGNAYAPSCHDTTCTHVTLCAFSTWVVTAGYYF